MASSISGSAGEAGATVFYAGVASGSVTADGSGNYTISGLANGGYTITPAKTGFVFTPASRAVTVSGSNITGVNFTGAAGVPQVLEADASIVLPDTTGLTAIANAPSMELTPLVSTALTAVMRGN